MQYLAIGDPDVTGRANHRHRLRQTLTARFGNHCFDIDPAVLVGARHHPEAIGRGTAIELCHDIEAVYPLIPVRVVPMGGAVLMPGDGGAASRFLDEKCFVERHEIVTVDRRRHLEQIWLAIGSKAGLGKLQRAKNEINHLAWRIGRRGRLGHFYRVSAIGQIGTAERVA